MKKLFLSFSTLLSHIADGKVTQDELDTGLFLFGCVRSHALQPGAQGETDERTWNKGKNAQGHPTLVTALLKAEEEGRAGWIRPESGVRKEPFAVLNALLEKQGLPSVPQEPGDSTHHSYPLMADRIAAAGLPLQVVYLY
jgi:hypothetical protein